jgi:D-alanyl-D-alanine dipeptidase
MPPLKPYSLMPIHECGEPLVPIPHDDFAFFEPHPYLALGAPYGAASPWMLRRSVLESLRKAQQNLQKLRPHWKFMLFDAYRPNEVQAFMVERELATLALIEGLEPASLTETDRERLLVKVFRIFAIPSDDPAMPPPHSTGAVFDLTLADANGHEVDMGSPVDENSDRSYPDYFALATDAASKAAHANRVLLHDLLRAEGFRRNPGEWWHFSRGDQLAVWVDRNRADAPKFAIYGRAENAL